MAKSTASSATPPASFEAALGELETIVRAMEAGQLPLEASLTSYERGVSLLKYCQETLGAAEQKLQILENSTLRDFAAAASTANASVDNDR
jgi:exodeoxyribonuclease VII small subunit